MAPFAQARARRAAPRLLALGGLAVALRRFGGPAYAVKGSWQVEPSTLTKVVKGDFDEVGSGLEPKVSFPVITYNRGGAALSVEGGELHLDYTTKLDDGTTLNFRTNAEQAWTASFLGADASLRVRGQGRDLDTLSWAAAQQSSVEGVGDVKVEFNSDKAYNLTVSRGQLAEIAGAQIDAKVHGDSDTLSWAEHAQIDAKVHALDARLVKGVKASYSVQNPVGVYELGQSKHIGRIAAQVAGGSAALTVEGGRGTEVLSGSYRRGLAGGVADLKLSRDNGALGYNVSYTRDLGDLVPLSPHAQVGVDEDGVYGKLSAGRSLGGGLEAYYEALGRLGSGADHKEKLMHALKLSNKLGYAQLVHGKGEAPRLQVGYEFSA